MNSVSTFYLVLEPEVVQGCPKPPQTKPACPDPAIPDECSSNEDCNGKKNCCLGICNTLYCVGMLDFIFKKQIDHFQRLK